MLEAVGRGSDHTNGTETAGDQPEPTGDEPELAGELTEAQLEALLFVAERPLARREIASLAGVDRATVDARLGDLEVALAGEESGSCCRAIGWSWRRPRRLAR